MWRLSTAPPPVPADVELHPLRVVASPERAVHFSLLRCDPLRIAEVRAATPERDAVPHGLLAMDEPTGAVRVEVGAARVAREIDPSDWLLHLLRDSGYELRQEVFKPGRLEPAFEALAWTPGRAATSHWRVVKEGDTLFTFEARADNDHFAKWASRFELCGESLFPLAPPGRQLAEPFCRASMTGLGGLSYRHPESWPLTLDARLKDEHPVPTAFRVENGRPIAILGLATWTADRFSTVDAMLAARAVELAKLGTPSGPLVASEADAPARLGPVGTATAALASRHGELRLVGGRVDDVWFCLSLIGPSRLAAPFAWMENKRVHDLALASLADG